MSRKSPPISRRHLLLSSGVLAGAGLTPSLIRSAFAQDPGVLAKLLTDLKPATVKPPIAAFAKSAVGEGIIGPWGEVRVTRSGSVALPIFMQSADKMGVANMGIRKPHVVIGAGLANQITWNSDGVAFSRGAKPEPWSKAVIAKLIKAIASDKQKARSLMQLRSAFATSYPVYTAMAKATSDKRVGSQHQKASGQLANKECFTRTEVVTPEVTMEQATEYWRSKEQQWEECFVHETSGADGLGCSLLPAGPARDACAAGFCTGKGFFDVLIEVIVTIVVVADAVTRDIVTCVASGLQGAYSNLWTLIDRFLPGLEKPGATAAKPAPKDVQAALKFLTDAVGVLGPFATCLLAGKWTVESAGTPIPMGDGNVAIPYGVRVCITAKCARTLTITGVGKELGSSWTAALTLLAALSPEFAALAGPIGIAVNASLAAIVAALPAAVVPVAAIILAFIILALIYGTALVGQLSLAEALGAFTDGEVCIVHPTIALAMIKALTIGIVPAELVPPVVVG